MFSALKIGHNAPDFELEGYANGSFGKWKLSDLKGKWVVLFFYPADFTFVCPTEVKAFDEMLPQFRAINTEVLGCSVDSKFVHKAWVEKELKLTNGLPLLADIHHSASIDYNVYVEEEAQSLRGTFIIDSEGKLRWYQISDNNIGRNSEEVLRVVEALQSGGLCPANWKKGDKHIQPQA